MSINAIFGNNGLIQSAEKGKIAQEKAEARERLELVLADAYAEKHVAKEKYNENEYLDKFIYSREPDAEVAEAEISLNGYTFELDRSVPQLGEYIGEAGNLPPTIRNIKVIEKTETSAKIEVIVARGEGVKYKYSIKKANEGDGNYTQLVEKEENTYEFTGLEKSNKYMVKVELIKDNQVVDTETIEIQMEGQGYIDSELAEAPAVAEGMTPVKWNGNNWVKTTNKDKEWYNYAEKKWANVVLGDATFNGETLDESKTYSMLVWIPRYAYQITSGYHQSGAEINPNDGTLGAGNINVVFLDRNNQDKNKTKAYSEEYPNYTTGNGMSDYVVHPAFNYGGTKLAGIWVGKYETSSKEGNSNSSSGDNVTNKTVQIKAGVSSWRYIQVSNIFTVCTEMNKSSNLYGLNTSDSVVDPHMMKNSEWGAVAYLSKSKYGKETEEVWINPNSNYITGQAGSSVSESETTSTNAYNTPNGMKASTTGNVWGVYDMSGGALEYVAAYVNNGNSNLTKYGSTLVNAADKYKDVYSTGNSDSYEINYAMSTPDRGYYGDAVWETSSNSLSPWKLSWYSDYANFIYSNSVFLRRGGYYRDTSETGVFHFSSNIGNDNSYYSFRVVVPVF